jgi:hypothetical protein
VYLYVPPSTPRILTGIRRASGQISPRKCSRCCCLFVTCSPLTAIRYPPSTAVFVLPATSTMVGSSRSRRQRTKTKHYTDDDPSTFTTKEKRELQRQRLLCLRRLPPRNECGHGRVIVLLPRRPLLSLVSITTCALLLSFNQLNPAFGYYRSGIGVLPSKTPIGN